MYEFLRFPCFKRKAVTFSYDDGQVHDKKLVEVFNKYNVKATFNIPSGLMGSKPFLELDELNDLYIKNGHEIAVHGSKHLYPTAVDITVFNQEVLMDRLKLEETTGKIIFGMAYAYGQYNEDVKCVLSNCGIRYSRTVKSTYEFNIPSDFLEWHPTCRHADEKLFPIIDKFVLDKDDHDKFYENKPMLLYVWGHSYEFEKQNNWEVIENACKKLANSNNIWFATNGEIYLYITAYNNLIYSADGSNVYNPTAIDVYLCINGKEVIAKAGQKVSI